MSEHVSSSGHSPVLDDFLALSRILTGAEGLKPELGRQYFDHLSSTPLNPFSREILGSKRWSKPSKLTLEVRLEKKAE
jgi:hypothetical protein